MFFFTLFNAIVRSVIEYASIIWAPTSVGMVLQLELIQNRFLRICFFRSNLVCAFPEAIHSAQGGFNYLSATATREVFGVLSLNERRDLHLLMFFFDLLNGVVDDSFLLSRADFYVPIRYLRVRPLFFSAPARAAYLRTLAFSRFYELYARLPSEVDIFGQTRKSLGNAAINYLFLR